MGKATGKILGIVLSCALLVGMIAPVSDAAGMIKLSSRRLTIAKGEKKILKVKNAKGKKAKWSIKSGSKNISLLGRKKTSVTIKGKKAGKAVVQAKIGKKKLTCKVTVKNTGTNKNKQEDVPQVPGITQAPETTQTPETTPNTEGPVKSPENQTPTESPINTPTVPPTSDPGDTSTESPGPSGTETEKEDIVIDLSNVTTTFTSSDKAKIDFSSQIPEGFDLSDYSGVEVVCTTTWENSESKSGWASGKIAVVQDKKDLNGTADGVAFTYSMGSSGGSVTVPFEKNLSGTVIGINIQPMMNKENGYKWPDGLTSVTVKSIVFKVRKEIASIPSTEFHYEGLDTSWIDSSKKMVALTFDDGPDGAKGPGMRIQEALHEAGAHATFFYIGSKIQNNREEVEQALKYGFEIANHSWDYNELGNSDRDVIAQKIEKTDQLLKDISGFNQFLFRAPGVNYGNEMYAVINAPFIDVSRWSNDWQEDVTKDQIIKNVKEAVDGDIINMHSSQAKTAEAVPEILAYFKEQGIQVVSVSELFAVRGEKLMTGVKYFKCPPK